MKIHYLFFALLSSFGLVLVALWLLSVTRVSYAQGTSSELEISPVMKNYNDGQQFCTSIYTVTNESDTIAYYVHEFYDNEQGGSVIHTLQDTIPASSIITYYLSDIAPIPNNYRGRAVVHSDQPFTATLTSCLPPATDTQLEISPVMKNYNDGQQFCTSIYTVTNESDTIAYYVHEFYDNEQGGSVIHTLQDTIPASSIITYYLSDIAPIPNNYRGRAVVHSDQPFTATLTSCRGSGPENTYSISGQILAYEDTLINGNLTQITHPLGYAVITLINHTKGTSVTTVSTAIGRYNSTINANIGDSLSVRASLIYRRNNTDFLQVQDASAPAAPIVYIETQPFLTTSATSIQQDLYFVATLPYIIPGSMSRCHLPDTAIMYHHFQEALDFTIDALTVTLDYELPIEVYAFDSSMDTNRARYDGGDASIHIGVANSSSQNPNRPKNREWHEFFHHLMKDTIGLPIVVPPDDNHSGFVNSDTADSWKEGWAELWPMILAEHLDRSQPSIYADRGDCEINSTPWAYLKPDAHGKWRSEEELSIAGILWDLHDTNNSDEDRDHINLSTTALWSILAKQNSDHTYRGLGNINEVYNVLTSTLPAEKTHIDEIFEAHGFFGDKGWVVDAQNRLVTPLPNQQGDKKKNTDELIGYGGRKDRLSTPYIDGAFLKVNLQSQQGQPIDSGTLLITVDFDPPYDIYDYSYEYFLFSGNANMVYLPAPWIDYTATVTVQALNSSTLPYSISNLDFWSMIPNSGHDYVAEKTFVISYSRLYLPLILK